MSLCSWISHAHCCHGQCKCMYSICTRIRIHKNRISRLKKLFCEWSGEKEVFTCTFWNHRKNIGMARSHDGGFVIRTFCNNGNIVIETDVNHPSLLPRKRFKIAILGRHWRRCITWDLDQRRRTSGADQKLEADLFRQDWHNHSWVSESDRCQYSTFPWRNF